MNTDKHESIATVLKEFPVVVFGYLFGSRATGHTWAHSDWDIAVYIEPDADFFDVQMALVSELSRTLRIDKVDVVILNRASPPLKHSVLKSGELIFCRDEEQRIEFFVRTMAEYFDTAPMRRFFKEAMFRRIEEGRYGRG